MPTFPHKNCLTQRHHQPCDRGEGHEQVEPGAAVGPAALGTSYLGERQTSKNPTSSSGHGAKHALQVHQEGKMTTGALPATLHLPNKASKDSLALQNACQTQKAVLRSLHGHYARRRGCSRGKEANVCEHLCGCVQHRLASAFRKAKACSPQVDAGSLIWEWRPLLSRKPSS